MQIVQTIGSYLCRSFLTNRVIYSSNILHYMNGNWMFATIILLLAGLATCYHFKNGDTSKQIVSPMLKIESWATRSDQSALLQKQPLLMAQTGSSIGANPQITVDDTKKYQSVDGFGFTLTGGSAMLINRMSSSARDALLRELFGNGDNQIAISFLRLSMGSSDLDSEVFSYNDLGSGQTDVDQNKFSIAPDRTNLIPVLKSILAINSKIKIISTPWSPPTWMKDNGKSVGGSLKPEYYASYAKYFVKYIQAMQAEGIRIYAITPQNEPLHPGNNPSMYFTAEHERDFIKNNLGPAFAAAGISTKIVIYDHNLDRPDYPTTIYNDANAAKYIDGAAFHMYAGDVGTMSSIHNSFPSKNLYFTEQWTSSSGSFDGDMQWHVKNIIIGTMRNWSKVALEWNLANDPSFGPHTPGGCTMCKGALTINGSSFTRNVAYYIIAHASKFVPSGSTRIDSNNSGSLLSVAFLRQDGKRVLIVYNDGGAEETFNLRYRQSFSPVKIASKEVKSIVF